MPIITPNWNENEGYVGDNPLAEGSGWRNDDGKGWVKWTPSTSPTLNPQGLNNLYQYNINTDAPTGEARYEIDNSRPVSTDPNAYYSQLGSDLANSIWENSAANVGGKNTEYNNLLESIKDLNPSAYYNAKIQLLGKELGHHRVMGESEENTVKQLQSLYPQAIQNGLNPQQISETINSSFSSGAEYGQLIKNKAKEGSSFYADSLIGALKVGALAMGAYGLDTALAAGAASGLEAAATGPTYAELGYAPSAYGGSGAYSASELMGPTYQELGVTGLSEGAMGPTYGEMGFTGLNQGAAIDAANAAAQGGLSAKDVLTNANRLKSIAKLLTGSETSPIYGKNVPTASQWQQQAAQNFVQATPEQFGGLYRMNQNPFSFGTQGQTVASPGMYDVSGSNSMANALRKA